MPHLALVVASPQEAALPDLFGELPEEEQTLTAKELRAVYRVLKKLSPRTRKSYEGILRRYRKAGYSLDADSLASWVEEQAAKGRAPATIRLGVAAIRKVCALLKRSFDSLENEALVGSVTNACRENRGKGRGQAKAVCWEDADKAASLAEQDGSWAGTRDASMIRLASDAMLRTSEVSNLDVGDVRFYEDGTGDCTIRHSKTDGQGVGATMFLGPPTCNSLRAWLEVSGIERGALFVGQKGKRMGGRLGPEGVHLAFRRRFKRAGLDDWKHMGGHSLRRGAAVSFVRANASLLEICEAGRWKNPAMAALYVRGELAATNGTARYRYAS